MPSSDSESRSGLVLELAEEFLDRYRAGERPPLKEYVERHPDLADEIREVFPAMAMMEKIALADDTQEERASGAATIPQFDQLGDYRVLREVGRGGMGVVYEAEQVSLGRHVALKVLPPQSLKDTKQRRRFEREAKAAAKLHHTNIVPVFGVGEQEETPYYVMQFIQGQGLDAVLDELKRLRTAPRPSVARAAAQIETTVPYEKNGRDVSAADVAQSLLTGRFGQNGDGSHMPEDQPTATIPAGSGSDVLSSSSLTLPSGGSRGKSRRATYWEGVARIGQQVGEALAYAHGQGIIHRDVKPSNLLLDTKGTVWVADFGLAKASDQQDLTHTGDILGTLRYMPPEAFGGKADSRGDIYSLGLTLYELLAFRPAFDERDRGRLVKQVTNDVPPPLKKLNPEVPRDLETIVQKAIERDPNHRYQSSAELADDLRRFVDDEPIQARRASIAERVARWGRRNPAVASLLGAVTLLLLAIIASLWQADRQARRALAVQTALRQEADRTAELERKAKAEALAEKQKADSANKSLLATQDSLRSTLYAAQMNLTKVAWDSGNATRTLDLLADVVPKPGEPDLRGFEWNYGRRQVHGERTVHKLQGVEPRFARFDREDAFSPDGSLIAHHVPSQGRPGGDQLQVYETTGGRLLDTFPLETSGKVADSRSFLRAAFSSDNQVLAVHYSYPLMRQPSRGPIQNIDHRVHLIAWKLSDRSVLLRESYVEKSVLPWTSIGLNDDGSRLAVGTWLLDRSTPMEENPDRGLFRVLDLKEKREIFHIGPSDKGYVQTEFSPDGKLVAYLTYKKRDTNRVRNFFSGYRITILEVETGRPRFDPEGIQSDFLGTFHFSPDGRRLVSIGGTGSEPDLSIFDVETEKLLAKESLSEFLVGASEFTFSPDSRVLYTASRTGPAAQINDVETGRLIKKLNLGASGTVKLGVRQSDRRLLTTHYDYFHEWDLPSVEPTSLDDGFVVKDYGGGIVMNNSRRAVLLRDGRQLLLYGRLGGVDPNAGEFSIFDVTAGPTPRRFPSEREGEPRAWIYWPQSDSKATRLASVVGNLGNVNQEELRVRVWDLVAGRVLLTLDRERLGGVPSNDVNLSSQVWDATGTFLALGLRGVDLGPDGTGTLRADHFVAIVEVPSGRVVRKVSTGTELPVASFCPNGKLLAIGTTAAGVEGRVAKIDLVEPDSGRLVRRLSGDLATLGRLVFSANGQFLAAATSGGERGQILIWNLAEGPSSEPVRIQDRGGMPFILAFTPDGRRLATADSGFSFNSGQVKLWDTASGRDLATWSIAKGPVKDLAFDPTGRRLRVASVRQADKTDAGVTLLDASPLAPEIEADDLIARLGPQFPLNAELVAKLQSDADLDPAIRAEALKMAPLRFESSNDLRSKAATWLELPAAERTPEVMRLALSHADRAVQLMDRPTSSTLCVQAEARFRNRRFAEALEAIREARVKWGETTPNDGQLRFRIEAVLALTEARLGHTTEAEAALANARKLWDEANPSVTSLSLLLVEAEAVLGQIKGTELEKANSSSTSHHPD